jgi:hypothetical protein
MLGTGEALANRYPIAAEPDVGCGERRDDSRAGESVSDLSILR